MGLKLAAILLAGLAAEWLATRILRRAHRSVETQEAGRSIWLRVLLATIRGLLELTAVAAFMGAAYGSMALLDPAHEGKVLALALINARVVVRTTMVFASLILAPRVSALRLMPMSDESASYGLIWIRCLTNVLIYGYFIVEAMPVLLGSLEHYLLVRKRLGLVLMLMLVVLIMQNKAEVAALIRGKQTGALARQFRRRVAEVWHLVAVIYTVAIYAVWVLEVPGGFEYVLRATVLSGVIAALVHTAVIVARRLLGRAFSLTREQRARFTGLEVRASRYVPIITAGLQVFLYGAGAIAILQVWGADAIDWIVSPLGASIVRSAVHILVILGLALLAWELTTAGIERYLAARDATGSLVQRGQRVQTLLPLVRNIVLVVLSVFVVLTILAELGVNIGPLIAGAGIIGLAVGFGAQTFVKDVITGFFILIEDTVAIGDIVVVGGYAGKVEAMSIRSIQLRDLKGEVHRIPFSEVTSTTNRSKVFSFAFFDIGVAYREDVDRCMDVIRQVGAVIREDPTWGLLITEDIEIMGVQSFDDSAVVIRARIKVLPGKQYPVERAFNRLIKNRFDAEGIEIPFPHRTIYFGVDGMGNAPAARSQLERPPPESIRPGLAEDTNQDPVGPGADSKAGDDYSSDPRR